MPRFLSDEGIVLLKYILGTSPTDHREASANDQAAPSEGIQPGAIPPPQAELLTDPRIPQSRKATFRMALDCPSVFMTTWCQPYRVIVAWSACRTRPLT